MKRLARALASPIGVLVTLPLLVIGIGLSILLLGRDATSTATEDMASTQLVDQAVRVQADVALALDQAAPILERVRAASNPFLPRDMVLLDLHDLAVGRPGVAYVSISYRTGMFRGAYLDESGRVDVQESSLGITHTAVQRYRVVDRRLVLLREELTKYDPRQREFYRLAEKTRVRTWTQPYTFFKDNQTGITCVEPVFDSEGDLRAVITVDFAVGALSSYLGRATGDTRTMVYTRDGVVLAYPGAVHTNELLRYTDVNDPALTALVQQPAAPWLELRDIDGTYLAAITPVGGARAGASVPLDWYVATVVPTNTLLGPTRSLGRRTLLVSALALAAAVMLALVLAWNLLRMRRLVAASRAEAARVRELGSYRLVAKLGAGGMGEVWRAEHHLLARSAAIKLIRSEALANPKTNQHELRERFRREAQTLASMQSRHTTTIYDYGVAEDGTFYYVMELLDGLDFESLVLRYGALPAARVIHLAIQACSSLAEAHAAGLFHRDIKPPNLFTCRAADEVDVVKLLDFGIVHSADEPLATGIPVTPASGTSDKLTQIGSMLGTPGFMAKEQILGLPIDGRADLYALACVMWWMLTGAEVYRRTGRDSELFDQHLFEPIPSLRDHMRTWCPVELEAVLTRCLAKEPSDRPADAMVLAAELRAIVIPAEHAWTDEAARAWWASYRPPAAVPSVAVSKVQRLLPQETPLGD